MASWQRSCVVVFFFLVVELISEAHSLTTSRSKSCILLCEVLLFFKFEDDSGVQCNDLLIEKYVLLGIYKYNMRKISIYAYICSMYLSLEETSIYSYWMVVLIYLYISWMNTFCRSFLSIFKGVKNSVPVLQERWYHLIHRIKNICVMDFYFFFLV